MHMKEKGNNSDLSGRQAGNKEKDNLQGYLLYPAGENIYGKYQKGKNINPEDISKNKGLLVNQTESPAS